jgi:hypothetical protein
MNFRNRMTSVSGIAATIVLLASSAHADSPFASLAGAWSGTGQVHLTGGQHEALKCKAYYNPKAGGAELSLAMRCASASAKLDFRATLEYVGGAVTGSWEERSYNASGQVTGKASNNNLSLHINGGGLTASMSVQLTGASQAVSISTNGAGFTGVSIHLSKG